MKRTILSSNHAPIRTDKKTNTTHRALVWLFPGVATHVHQQHVLGLEWLPITDAPCPVAHELLLAVAVDVVAVDVLHQAVKVLALGGAPCPAALVVVGLLHARVLIVYLVLVVGQCHPPRFLMHSLEPNTT